MRDAEILDAIDRCNCHYIIGVTDEISTSGELAYIPAQDVCKENRQSLDLAGKRAPDSGCRDGVLSFAAEGGHLLVETSMWRVEPRDALLFFPSPQTGLSELVRLLPREGPPGHARLDRIRQPRARVRPAARRRALDRAARRKKSPAQRAAHLPIRDVTRAVLPSVVGERELDPVLAQYWDGVHRLRTEEGG